MNEEVLNNIDAFVSWLLDNGYIEEIYNSYYDHENKEWIMVTPKDLYIKFSTENK